MPQHQQRQMTDEQFHEYPKLGFAVEQDVPADVYDAFERLVQAGFDNVPRPPDGPSGTEKGEVRRPARYQ